MPTRLPSPNADEQYFWARVYHEVGLYRAHGKTPRQLINEPGFPLHHKRAWRLLEKWARMGLYDFGTALDLGYVTPEGMACLPQTDEE